MAFSAAGTVWILKHIDYDCVGSQLFAFDPTMDVVTDLGLRYE